MQLTAELAGLPDRAGMREASRTAPEHLSEPLPLTDRQTDKHEDLSSVPHPTNELPNQKNPPEEAPVRVDLNLIS